MNEPSLATLLRLAVNESVRDALRNQHARCVAARIAARLPDGNFALPIRPFIVLRLHGMVDWRPLPWMFASGEDAQQHIAGLKRPGKTPHLIVEICKPT